MRRLRQRHQFPLLLPAPEGVQPDASSQNGIGEGPLLRGQGVFGVSVQALQIEEVPVRLLHSGLPDSGRRQLLNRVVVVGVLLGDFPTCDPQ